MKNILKVLCLVLLVTSFSCSDDDGGRFNNDPTTGWVSFRGPTTQTTISNITEQIVIPLRINVPVYENGLNVSYELRPVSGNLNEIVSGSGGTVFVDPTDATRANAAIVLNFSNIANISDQIIFDVVLTGVDVAGVGVGVDDSSITTFRISTPCPIDINGIAGTYDVSEVFTSGVNEGLSLAAAFGESYQLELTVNTNDLTGTQVFINNSPGFDVYINNGTIATFDTCGGTVSFSADPLPVGGGFAGFAITSTSYTESPFMITADGTLGNFGPYQFILTKQ